MTMDPAAVHRLQKALDAARQAAHEASLASCDTDDIDEAIEAVTQELGKASPNRNTVTMYMNSLARSLIAVHSAGEARGEIDHALRSSGLPCTWEC